MTVPVYPVWKAMTKHLSGEEKLRHVTVTEDLIPQ